MSLHDATMAAVSKAAIRLPAEMTPREAALIDVMRGAQWNAKELSGMQNSDALGQVHACRRRSEAAAEAVVREFGYLPVLIGPRQEYAEWFKNHTAHWASKKQVGAEADKAVAKAIQAAQEAEIWASLPRDGVLMLVPEVAAAVVSL